jgi:hypothetical protein
MIRVKKDDGYRIVEVLLNHEVTFENNICEFVHLVEVFLELLKDSSSSISTSTYLRSVASAVAKLLSGFSMSVSIPRIARSVAVMTTVYPLVNGSRSRRLTC